jgi:glycosyltransferase involved in cell wall biosynthesis
MSDASLAALVSIVMPVRDGIGTLDRAVCSVLRQTLTFWELIAIDDSSADGSYELLASWGRRDSRIRVLRTTGNRGPAAARNEGIRNARSEIIAYLDCDDEYYPEFLERAVHFSGKGEVLVFGYDVVDDTNPDEPMRSWDPRPYKGFQTAMIHGIPDSHDPGET